MSMPMTPKPENTDLKPETMKYISVIVPPFRDDECEFIDQD